jgi:glycerol-3-phosphate acyltransferase PlsY
MGVGALEVAVANPSIRLLCAVAYAAGSVPFGYLLARFVARVDVRTQGSGNIGASNVTRVVGKKLGALTLLLDAGKGALPTWAALHVVDATLDEHRFFAAGLVGFCALLGHCFSVWLKFHGGKGVATALGVLLVLAPGAALVGVATFAGLLLLTKKASVASLLAAAATFTTLAVSRAWDVELLPIAACVVVIVAKHHENLRRLWQRQELSV